MTGIITYSRNVSIPVTTICRNRCGYCSFSREPGSAATPLLPPEEIERLLRLGAEAACTEALFITGERADDVSPAVCDRLSAWGYRNMVEYLVAMGNTALQYGLLPHTNAGVLSQTELSALRSVNASMGLMLESSSERLCRDGGPHAGSPGKRPAARLHCIEQAGELNIPFTTGILVGIGETPGERIDALSHIARLHHKYGHIQEVIIQPFCPKPNTPMSSNPAPPIAAVLDTIAHARLILGPGMNIQAPPNLVQSHELCLRAGANDWGGLSPFTLDTINPDNHWPGLPVLEDSTRAAGATLCERLPVYPEFVTDHYLPRRVREVAANLMDNNGYARKNRRHG